MTLPPPPSSTMIYFPSKSFVLTLSSISCLLFPIPSSYRFSHGSSLTLIDNTRHEQSVKTAKEISIRCILLILLPSLLLSRFPMPDAVNLIYPILPGIRRWRSDSSSCHIYLQRPTSDICQVVSKNVDSFASFHALNLESHYLQELDNDPHLISVTNLPGPSAD